MVYPTLHHSDKYVMQLNCSYMGEFNGKAYSPVKMPLMQFTGLKDKSGREIYDGDIIKTPNGFVGKITHGTHSYKSKTDRYECTGWLFERISDGHIEFMDSEIAAGVVVGNIHENPQLLAP